MSSIFGNSFLSTGIRSFKDALAKGTNEFSDFGTALSGKLKQAATAVGLANTLNDVENAEGRRGRVNRPGCVSFVKEWIDARQISEELKDELDELYGGTVVRSLCSLAEREGEVEDEQYPFGEAPTEDDACAICLLALKTLGNRGGGCTPAFRIYLQRVLNLSQDKFLETQSKLSAVFKGDLQLLTITVNEISDPDVSFSGAAVYCKAGVLISQDQDLSHTTLDDLHKQGHIKDVVKTAPHLSSVQSWKEAIELSYLGQDCIVLIELWEANKTTSQQMESPTGRKSLHFADAKKKKKSSKKSSGLDQDLLIGTATIKITSSKQGNATAKSAPFEYSTAKHPHKKTRGKIKYFVNTTSKQFKLSTDESMLQHKLLCCSFMAYDSLDHAKSLGELCSLALSPRAFIACVQFPQLYCKCTLCNSFKPIPLLKSNQRHIRAWNGLLSAEANHLLRLHALQLDLNEIQQLVVQVIGLIDYLQWYLVDISSLFDMVCRLFSSEATGQSFDELEQCNSLCKLATECPDTPWIVELMNAFDKFVVYYEDILTHHIFYFKPDQLDSLHNHIRMIKLMCSLGPFTSRPGCSVDDFRNRAEKCMKEGCKEWYESVYSTAVPADSSEDDKLSAYTDVLDHINTFLKDHLAKFNDVFKSFEITNINYSELMYYTLDGFIYDAMEDLILNEAEIGTSCTYHMFISIRKFCQFNESMSEDYGVELKCGMFSEWFEPFVKDWIDEITHTVKQEISVIFEECNLEQSVQQSEDKTNEECKECCALVSECALEVKNLYCQLSKYWCQLKWPVAVEDFVFAHRFVKGICQLITFYANKTEQRANGENFFAEGENMYALNPLIYLSMNSLDTCLEILKILPTQFDLNRCICNLGMEGTEVTQEQAQESLDAVIQASNDDIEKKMEAMFAKLEAKLKADLRRLIEGIFASTAGSSAEDAASPLCNLFSEMIDMYRKTLLATMLERLLKFLWNLVCNIFDNVIEVITASKRSLPPFTKDVLKIVYLYFHASGLSQEALESLCYLGLCDKVDCKAKSTEDLAAYYFTLLDKKQENAKGENGILTVNVTYSRAESYLLIAVISCSLKTLDSTGLPDPYVEVHLLPPGDAMKKSVIKTETMKKTLTPQFKKEVHEMTIPQEAYLDKTGISLVFIVKNKSKVLGLSLIPCKEISRYGIRGKRGNSPKVDRKIDDRMTQQLSLLTPLCGSGTEAFKELSIRASNNHDSLAKQIIKSLHGEV